MDDEDRQGAPGPSSDDRSRDAPSGSFRTIVAVLIAVVSALGATAAWRASVISIRASDLTEDGLLELVQKEQIRAQLDSQIDQDLRLLAQYQRHVNAWRLLREDAKEVRGDEPQLAETLEAQARTEIGQARALAPFFRTSSPGLGEADGTFEFDRDFVRRQLLEFQPEFTDLRPDATFRESRETFEITVNLVLVVALFIASLFFLTLAQFTSERIRGLFAGAGVLVAAAAVALFLVVGGFG
ncbi:MAG TPA: hypothetical protein VGB51_09600 [Actinomycetota bacterium]